MAISSLSLHSFGPSSSGWREINPQVVRFHVNGYAGTTAVAETARRRRRSCAGVRGYAQRRKSSRPSLAVD
jgi:hypothetical protein